MRHILAPLAAAAAVVCAGAAIVTNVGAVRQVEADRRTAAADREMQVSREDRLSPTEAAGLSTPSPPIAKTERFLRYEMATSGARSAPGNSPAGSENLSERLDPPPPGRTGDALPPKLQAPGERKPTTLFQPVATAAGLIEAKGYTIAVAGVDPVKPDETCDSAGRSWPCGARARAAFRAFLRGRAVSCTVPPQPDQTALTAECVVGKTDVGGWLVSNGWARAAAGGPLEEQAKQAKDAGKGIYGTAPDLTAPSAAMTASGMPAPPAESATILDGATVDLDVPGPMDPIVVAPFPPAPAPFPAVTPPVDPREPVQ